MIRRALPLVVAALALTVACGGSSPTQPSTPSTPTPPTQPTTFTITGTVSESVPTTGTRIEGATVRIVDGPNAGRSTTSDGSGNYRFDAITRGGFSMSAEANGYESAAFGINLTADTSRAINLRPNLQIIDTPFTGSVSGGDAACAGSFLNSPCKRHSMNVHHSGTISARVTWTGSADVDLELWNSTAMIATSNGVGSSESISASVTAGSYVLRVVYYEGATIANYTLTATRPN